MERKIQRKAIQLWRILLDTSLQTCPQKEKAAVYYALSEVRVLIKNPSGGCGKTIRYSDSLSDIVGKSNGKTHIIQSRTGYSIWIAGLLHKRRGATITNNELNIIFDEQVKRCEAVLLHKGKEYAPDETDRLSSLRRLRRCFTVRSRKLFAGCWQSISCPFRHVPCRFGALRYGRLGREDHRQH